MSIHHVKSDGPVKEDGLVRDFRLMHSDEVIRGLPMHEEQRFHSTFADKE